MDQYTPIPNPLPGFSRLNTRFFVTRDERGSYKVPATDELAYAPLESAANANNGIVMVSSIDGQGNVLDTYSFELHRHKDRDSTALNFVGREWRRFFSDSELRASDAADFLTRGGLFYIRAIRRDNNRRLIPMDLYNLYAQKAEAAAAARKEVFDEGYAAAVKADERSKSAYLAYLQGKTYEVKMEETISQGNQLMEKVSIEQQKIKGNITRFLEDQKREKGDNKMFEEVIQKVEEAFYQGAELLKMARIELQKMIESIITRLEEEHKEEAFFAFGRSKCCSCQIPGSMIDDAIQTKMKDIDTL